MSDHQYLLESVLEAIATAMPEELIGNEGNGFAILISALKAEAYAPNNRYGEPLVVTGTIIDSALDRALHVVAIGDIADGGLIGKIRDEISQIQPITTAVAA